MVQHNKSGAITTKTKASARPPSISSQVAKPSSYGGRLGKVDVSQYVWDVTNMSNSLSNCE